MRTSRLWPGEFVRVRLLVETLKDARDDPLRRRAAEHVRAVRLGRSSRTTPPRAGRSSSGASVNDLTVVTKGLNPGERVVVSGQYRLRPGVKVDANSAASAGGRAAAP